MALVTPGSFLASARPGTQAAQASPRTQTWAFFTGVAGILMSAEIMVTLTLEHGYVNILDVVSGGMPCRSTSI